MAIEESKISDLIASYEERENLCRDTGSSLSLARANLYYSVIKDLESLLPRKTLADLNIDDYGELTGIVVEYGGRRGILLGGSAEAVTVFTPTDRYINWCDPHRVFPLDEDRIWDETGTILK